MQVERHEERKRDDHEIDPINRVSSHQSNNYRPGAFAEDEPKHIVLLSANRGCAGHKVTPRQFSSGFGLPRSTMIVSTGAFCAVSVRPSCLRRLTWTSLSQPSRFAGPNGGLS